MCLIRQSRRGGWSFRNVELNSSSLLHDRLQQLSFYADCPEQESEEPKILA